MPTDTAPKDAGTAYRDRPEPTPGVLRESRAVFYALAVLLGLATLVFMVRFLPASRSYPWSDEWHFLPAFDMSWGGFFAWLLSPIGDHLLPLQKLVTVTTLALGDFDFRALIATNYLIATALAVLALATARAYRGYLCVGDLAIPAFALNLGGGPTFWGMHFFILSVMFFPFAFLYLAVTSERGSSSPHLLLALLMLLLAALCGISGMILSSTLALVLVGYFGYEFRRFGRRRHAGLYALLGACVLLNAVLWLVWQPTPNSSDPLHARLDIAAGYLVGLAGSSLSLYAVEHAGWKAALLTVLVATGLVAGTLAIWRSRGRSLADVVLVAALVADLFLVVALALGRSNYQPWSNGLVTNYGYVTILAPIVAWIVFSSRTHRVTRTVVGVILVALFARAYQVGWDWRVGQLSSARQENRTIEAVLASDLSPEDITDGYMTLLFYRDTPGTREAVERGIVILRRDGSRHSPR